MKIAKKIIKEFSSWLDDIIEAGGAIEMVDGLAINFALNFANNKWGDSIPDEYTPQIEALLTAIMNGNYELAKEMVASILAGLINTPFIDDTEQEIEAYRTFINTIEKLITGLINKKAA